MPVSNHVYLAQLKCNQNHCVLALAGEFANEADAAILVYRLGEQMNELSRTKILNYECGICKSTNLHVQIGRTKFRTMEEARPALEQSAEAQRQTAEWLKGGKN